MQALLMPTDTQAQMVQALDRWLADHWRFEQRQAAMASADGLRALWQGLATEIGVVGAALPESAGGMGGGMADHLLIAQALGRALAGEPYIGTAVIAAGLLTRHAQGPGHWAEAALAAIVEGRCRVALAADEPGSRHHLDRIATGWAGGQLSGRKTLVVGAPVATHLIVSARAAGAAAGGNANGSGEPLLLWVAADAPGVQRRDLRSVDGQWASELGFDGVVVAEEQVLARGDAALQALGRAVDEATLVTGAEAIGVMDRLMRDTVDYANQRRQFGVPIASFQALQHRLADMHLAMVQARALVAATADRLDAAQPLRERAVSSAQVAVARACRAVGQGAVQIHGGMGMTDELWIGHGFKRLTQIERQYGSIEAHLRRVERTQTAAAEATA